MFPLYKGQDMPLAQRINAPKTSGKLNIQLQAAQPGRCTAKVPLLHTGSSGKAGNVSLFAGWWRSTLPKLVFICLPKRWEVYPRQSRQCKANLLAVPALQEEYGVVWTYLTWTDQFLFKLNYEWFSLCLLGLQFQWNWELGSLNHRTGFKREAGRTFLGLPSMWQILGSRT